MRTPFARAVLCAAACASLSLSSLAARATTVIHSNDVLGELESCGCRSNPQGGLARKSNWLRKLGDGSLLQLDAGDMLFPTNTVPALLAEQWKVQAGYHLKALDLLKHDAAVPGEKDFALGFAAFEKLRKNSKVRYLAANLRKKNGAQAFEPSAIFTRKGKDGKPLRIAVLGLVGEELPWPLELKANSAFATATKEVPLLRKKADIVIALTHQGYEKDRELAKAVPGIDLIIGGHTQSFLQKPIQEGKTWVFQSSFRNQYVGAIPLPFDGQNYQLQSLDAGFDSPADSPTEMDKLVKEFKAKVAEVNSREEARTRGKALASAGAAKLQTFPACAQCHLKQYNFWRATPHMRAYVALLDKEQFKNKECLECHSLGLGRPNGYTDVNRLAFMAKPGETEAEGEDGAPLPHQELVKLLVGLQSAPLLPSVDEKTRTTLNLLRRAYTPVQCENCHPAGGDHPFGGAPYPKKVEDTACLKCHTFERAPGWYTKSGQLDTTLLPAKRAQMTCPAGNEVELSE